MSEGYYREVVKKLAQLGYAFHAPAKGSHEKWKHQSSGKMIIVPHNLKSRHTANSILKDAGSSRKF